MRRPSTTGRCQLRLRPNLRPPGLRSRTFARVSAASTAPGVAHARVPPGTNGASQPPLAPRPVTSTVPPNLSGGKSVPMATAAGAVQAPRGRPVTAAARPATEVGAARDGKKEQPDASLEDRALQGGAAMAGQRPDPYAAVDHPGADLRGAADALGRDALELDAIYADRLGDQLLDDSIYSGKTAPDHADTMMITPTDLTPADDPFAAPKQPEVALDGTSAAMDLRRSDDRAGAVGAYGRLATIAVRRVRRQ